MSDDNKTLEPVKKPITFEVKERDDDNYRGIKITINNPNLNEKYQKEEVDIVIIKDNMHLSVMVPHTCSVDFDKDLDAPTRFYTTTNVWEAETLKQKEEELNKIKEAFKLLRGEE